MPSNTLKRCAMKGISKDFERPRQQRTRTRKRMKGRILSPRSCMILQEMWGTTLEAWSNNSSNIARIWLILDGLHNICLVFRIRVALYNILIPDSKLTHLYRLLARLQAAINSHMRTSMFQVLRDLELSSWRYLDAARPSLHSATLPRTSNRKPKRRNPRTFETPTHPTFSANRTWQTCDMA